MGRSSGAGTVQALGSEYVPAGMMEEGLGVPPRGTGYTLGKRQGRRQGALLNALRNQDLFPDRAELITKRLQYNRRPSVHKRKASRNLRVGGSNE